MCNKYVARHYGKSDMRLTVCNKYVVKHYGKTYVCFHMLSDSDGFSICEIVKLKICSAVISPRNSFKRNYLIVSGLALVLEVIISA